MTPMDVLIVVERFFLYWLAYSFAGWVWETGLSVVLRKRFEDRGMLNGPICPIYGFGGLLVVVLLHDVNNPLSLFLSSGVLACTLEYASSWAIEKLYHMRFWDYSGKPFNINGRICLLYSLFWGALGIFWIKDIYPFMAKWILKLPNRAGKILTWVLSIFLAVNCLVSAAAVYRWSERLHDEPPKTWIGSVMDARFPNERMERIYANMNFGDSE